MFTSLLKKTSSPGHLAFLGLLATALGVVAIVWPGVTIGVVVALFAIYCFSHAIGQLVAMFTVERSVGRDILRLLVAAIDVAAGIVAVSYPGITAEVLTIVVGIWAMVGGSVELYGAFAVRDGWLGFAGFLTVAAGIALIAAPGIGTVTLALILGIYLLCYGVTLLASAVSAKRESVDAHPQGHAAAA
jgi:uncharacterized membrane protein HdeD (DUF308 family)